MCDNAYASAETTLIIRLGQINANTTTIFEMENIMKRPLAKVLLLFVMLAVTIAVFSGCRKIVVTFNPGGGEIIAGDVTGLYDGEVPVTAPDVKRDGYVFDGWDIEFSAPETDIEVSAKWKKLHLITFDIIEDSDDDNIVNLLTEDQDVSYPTEPVREGYVFDGWDKQVDKISEDTVVAAKWRKLYTVTFNLEGGTTAQNELLTQIIAEGDAATSPDVQKQYMEPVRWDAEFSCITADITVNAIWERRELTSTEIAKLITPATVAVNTYRRNNVEWATGSGFFIDGEGTIITNYHVIENAYAIKIKTDDEKLLTVTHVVAFDKELDIAILKIAEKSPNYLEISDREIEKGDVVYAIGSSLGKYDGSFTTGLISTVSREVEGQNYIQISAAVSPGNSGGPLVDSRGFVIGINTLSDTAGQNINFSIPIARVDKLKEVNLTVLSWFDKYADIKWWIFENTVVEKETIVGLSSSPVDEGVTISGKCQKNDIDIFYYNYIPDIKSTLKSDDKLDAYLYFYSTDESFIDNIYIGFCEMNINTKTMIKAYVYNYVKYYEYNNGYMLCIGLYDVFGQNINFNLNKFAVYVINEESITGSYKLFVTTEIRSKK